MSPQATQGYEAKRERRVWPLQGQSGTSQTSRAQPPKGVGREKGGQSTSGGWRLPRIYGATLGKAGAPPKVVGWVMEEWKGKACPPEQVWWNREEGGGADTDTHLVPRRVKQGRFELPIDLQRVRLGGNLDCLP